MNENIEKAPESEAEINERKKVLFYYILFFGSAAMTCIPLVYTSIVGLIICLLTLVGLYSTKSGAEEDGYLESHMVYLIHTFWYAALFMFYSATAAALYIAGFASYTDTYNCLEGLPKIAFGAIQYGSPLAFIEAVSLCWRMFILKNEFHIFIAGFLAFAPIFTYLVYRYIRGWMLAVKQSSIHD